ncbi:MAG: hypothetical protein K9J37_07575 [Saprospiraceae bacterium]|nr:hypothetical protein [Saprospiraceae bacterium]MCF8249756.1 hypothetical protein [Saprospiraceae bacterium]MCF8279241.1 hypothetical protein [Bacteroidales bacterium]MCF8312789.1 hypothetical protein [Saprospiraceae bacterium]MCF8441236.1 hypothetical protein [Saprospiraceae bacterium]
MKAATISIFITIAIATFFSCQKDDTTPSLNKEITIRYGETVDIAGEMAITFDEIVEDSRCPCTDDCLSSGRVVVRLIGNVSGPSYNCPFGENSIKTFNGYETKLLEVLPAPCDIDSTTTPNDYKVKVVVKKVG